MTQTADVDRGKSMEKAEDKAESGQLPRNRRQESVNTYEERSLFLLSLRNPVRRGAIWMVENGLNDVSLVMIIGSTICLCLADPLDNSILMPESPVRNVLDTSSMIFSAIFVTEAAIKIVAFGFCLGKQSYMRSGWNVLDFCIAILGAIADFGGGTQSNSEKALRSLRALRPLRTISRFADLRGLVELLLRVVPRLSYLLGVVFLIVYIFAVIATNLWSGLGRLRCYDAEMGGLVDETQICTPGSGSSAWAPDLGRSAASTPTGSKPCLRGQQCLPLYGGALAGADYDDVGQSYSTCVQVITLQGWAEIMENVQDSFSPYAGIVFLALVVIVPLNILFLFQGLLLHTLAELRMEEIQRRKRKITQRLMERFKVHAMDTWIDYTCTRRVVHKHEDIRAYIKVTGMRDEASTFRALLLLRRVNHLWYRQVKVQVSQDTTYGVEQVPSVVLHEDLARFTHAHHNDSTNPSHPPPPHAALPAMSSFSLTARSFSSSFRRAATPPPSALRSRPAIAAAAEEGEDGEGDAAAGRRRRRGRQRRRNKGLLRKLAMSKGLERGITVVIILNTLAMAMDHDRRSIVGLLWPSDQKYMLFQALLSIANLAFTAVFFLEMVVKIVGMGTDAIRGDALFFPSAPLAYFRSGFNMFDCAIVAVTAIDVPSTARTALCQLHAQTLDACPEAGTGLSVLRMFRLLRLVRLLRQFPEVQKQVRNLLRIARPAASHSGLFLLFILIAAAMAVGLVGGRLAAAPGLVTSLTPGLRGYVRLPGDPLPTSIPGRPCYIDIVDPDRGGLGVVHVTVVTGFTAFGRATESAWVGLPGPDRYGREDVGVLSGLAPRCSFDTIPDALLCVFELITLQAWDQVSVPMQAVLGPGAEVYLYVLVGIGRWFLSNVFVAIVCIGSMDLSRKSATAARRGRGKEPPPQRDPEGEGDVQGGEGDEPTDRVDLGKARAGGGVPFRVFGLMLGGPRRPTVRYVIGLVVESRIFGRCMVAAILLSTALLCCETYPAATGATRTILDQLNTACTIVFAVELGFKVIWFGPRLYAASNWNRLDALVVASSVADAIATAAVGNSGTSSLKALRVLRVLRALRALRALRFIAKKQSLRIVTATLATAGKPVVITGSILSGFFATTAMLGMQLFSGGFWRCSDLTRTSELSCQGFTSDGTGRVWTDPLLNFDWIGSAFLTVFTMATADGWATLLAAGTDSTGKYLGPRAGANQGAAAYFALVVFAGHFIMLNMFKSVFIELFQYNSALVEARDRALAVPRKPARQDLPDVWAPPAAQATMGYWAARKLRCPCAAYYPPAYRQSTVRRGMLEAINTVWFEGVMGVVILSSAGLVALHTYKMSPAQTLLLDRATVLINAIFTSEALVKLFCMHPRRYLTVRGNHVDIALVLFGAPIVFSNLYTAPSDALWDWQSYSLQDPAVFRLLRLFNLVRLFRLVKMLPRFSDLTLLVDTLLHAAPTVAILLFLLTLTAFIFAVAGVQVWGPMCTRADVAAPGLAGVRCLLVDPGSVLTDVFNFKDVAAGTLVLLRICMLDGWAGLLSTLALTPPPRDPSALPSAAAALKEYLLFANTSGQTSSAAAAALKRAQAALPVCQTEGELETLAAAGLVDCGPPPVGGGGVICDSNCGNGFAAGLMLAPFVVVTVFVLLALIPAAMLYRYSANCRLAGKTGLARNRNKAVKLSADGQTWFLAGRLHVVYTSWQRRAGAKAVLLEHVAHARAEALQARADLAAAIRRGDRPALAALLRRLHGRRTSAAGAGDSSGEAMARLHAEVKRLCAADSDAPLDDQVAAVLTDLALPGPDTPRSPRGGGESVSNTSADAPGRGDAGADVRGPGAARAQAGGKRGGSDATRPETPATPRSSPGSSSRRLLPAGGSAGAQAPHGDSDQENLKGGAAPARNGTKASGRDWHGDSKTSDRCFATYATKARATRAQPARPSAHAPRWAGDPPDSDYTWSASELDGSERGPSHAADGPEAAKGGVAREGEEQESHVTVEAGVSFQAVSALDRGRLGPGPGGTVAQRLAAAVLAPAGRMVVEGPSEETGWDRLLVHILPPPPAAARLLNDDSDSRPAEELGVLLVQLLADPGTPLAAALGVSSLRILHSPAPLPLPAGGTLNGNGPGTGAGHLNAGETARARDGATTRPSARALDCRAAAVGWSRGGYGAVAAGVGARGVMERRLAPGTVEVESQLGFVSTRRTLPPALHLLHSRAETRRAAAVRAQWRRVTRALEDHRRPGRDMRLVLQEAGRTARARAEAARAGGRGMKVGAGSREGGEWACFMSRTAGRPFWYNRLTDETSWTRPAGAPDAP